MHFNYIDLGCCYERFSETNFFENYEINHGEHDGDVIFAFRLKLSCYYIALFKNEIKRLTLLKKSPVSWRVDKSGQTFADRHLLKFLRFLKRHSQIIICNFR